MQPGDVIRKYRKNKDMTQEEMAKRLGVTAPAVNKWENGNALPDITLLAPIARLLGITTDILLSFRDELTGDELRAIIYELDSMLKEKPYGEVFLWAKKKLEEYPNCEELILQIAIVLDAQRIVQDLAGEKEYDDYICSLYARMLESDDEAIRSRAADALFGFYMRKEKYEKAEEYLKYFPYKTRSGRGNRHGFTARQTGQLKPIKHTRNCFSPFTRWQAVHSMESICWRWSRVIWKERICWSKNRRRWQDALR